MINKQLRLSLNPYQLYALIGAEHPESFLLESLEGKGRDARYSFIGFSPKSKISAKGKVVTLDGQEKDSEKPAREIDAALPKIHVEKEGFVGGAVGYFSYDYVRNVEKLPATLPDELAFPDFEFGIYEDCVAYDHAKKTVHYISHGSDRSEEVMALSRGQLDLGAFSISEFRENMGKEEFEAAVGVAKEHIVAGDIFQVVLSRRYSAGYKGSLLGFYNYLKHTNPSPYMYFLQFGGKKIVGSSPENLVRVEGGKIDSYATLAGTMPRGATPEEDAALENKLRNDEKEKAEHLMLVDLTRNDLSKVSKQGSVKVDGLMDVHKFRHVQHLASHVAGELAEGNTCFDAFDAIFPAGTLTGAPKVRAMEIIEGLEKSRRGPYGGAVGYFSFNRNCDFAINIRTLVANKGMAHLQAGAGIVYDSVPEREYEETENKMRSLFAALGAVK